MNINRRRWIRLDGCGDNIIDKILSARGIKDKRLFLKGKISDMHDISLLNDAIKAVNLIKKVIKNNEKIVIYSDYDTDGACGAAVAYMILKELGADVDYYTNDRFTQGYGMCISGIDEVLTLYPEASLILTIDNGIVAYDAIDYAKSKGLTVIVTDHHEQGEYLPNADAVVNPKRKDSTYPFDGICGAVVAWKILRELYEDKNEANKFLDILAIATVGDVVPLIDENRIIVKEGLKLLNNNSRKSLAILREMTNTTEINAHFTLGFIYSPIFNAVSRLGGNINSVIDMLVSEDEEFIREKITELIDVNEKRKALTDKQVKKAELLLEKKGLKEVIVLYDEEFHEGIIGLIAGRLKEKYNRPAFVFTKTENGFLKGSARSIKEFDIKKNLDKCQDLLLGYGGHTMAGGLSLEAKNLEALEDRLIKLAQKILTEDDYIKKFYYVDILRENDITMDLVEDLKALEPYGEGFEKPLIRLVDFNVRRVFTMGKEKEHLKLLGDKISLIAWRQANHYEERGNPLKVTALGFPEINVYENNVNIQFVVDEDNFY